MVKTNIMVTVDIRCGDVVYHRFTQYGRVQTHVFRLRLAYTGGHHTLLQIVSYDQIQTNIANSGRRTERYSIKSQLHQKNKLEGFSVFQNV